jgi:hypothetical protein
VSGTDNRNAFVERCLQADLTEQEWRLAAALELSILGYWDKAAEAYKIEERLGEALLRSLSRLHGRSFQRARDGLIEKGVIVRFKPGKAGRGNRALYVLSETPAQARGLDGETPAQTPAGTPAENPAKTPAETPALPRGRSKKEEEEEAEDALEHEAETGNEHDPVSRAKRRLEDPAYAEMARRLWAQYAPNHFVQELFKGGTQLEVAQAVRTLLENEELAACG